MSVRYFVSQNVETVKLRLFTKGFRLIRSYTMNNVSAGYRIFQIDAAEFEKLATGVFLYYMTATNAQGETARSTVDVIVIVKYE